MKKLIFSTLHIFCFSLLFTTAISAQTETWTGNGGDNLWSNSANWSGNIIPSSTHDVVIPYNQGTVEFDMNSRTVRSMQIRGRNNVIVQSGRRLTVSRNNTSAPPNIEIYNNAVLINEGNLVVKDGDVGIYISGAFQNDGILELSDFTSHGIENRGKAVNTETGTIYLINVGSPTAMSIDVVDGGFYNDGDIIFSGKAANGGLRVQANKEFENQKKGNIIFEELGTGIMIIDGLLTNRGYIYMNQSSATGEFIRLQGTIENIDGGLEVLFPNTTNTRGVEMSSSGRFINRGSVEMQGDATNQLGFYLRDNSLLDNRGDGNLKTTRVGVGVYLVDFNVDFTNAGFCKFRYYTGLRNQSGTVVNSGTMRFDNRATLQNNRFFTNEACSDVILNGNFNNQQGTFTNEGWMSSTSYTNSNYIGNNINNFGVVHDRYNFFQGHLTAQGVRVGGLQMVGGEIFYQSALDVGNWGNYTVDEEWYRYSNLTNQLGEYDINANELTIFFPEAENRRFLWARYTDAVNGCSRKYYVTFDAPLTLEPDQEPNNGHDFAMHRAATGNETIKNTKVNVFPNPSNGQVTLQLDQVLSGASTLRLIDVTGRTVWTQEETDLSTLSLDLTDQAPGVYYLQVIQPGQGMTTERLVIQSN